jgi:hypothetical protein
MGCQSLKGGVWTIFSPQIINLWLGSGLQGGKGHQPHFITFYHTCLELVLVMFTKIGVVIFTKGGPNRP